MTIVIFFGICYIKWEERWKMGIYIDKFFLFLAGTWLLYNNVVIPVDVAYLLSGVIILFVSFYFDTVKNITAMNIVYISEIIAGLFFPKAICFLPIMIYTITYSVRGIKKHIIYGITYIMLAMKYVFGNYQDSSRHIMFVLVCFISAILAFKEYNIITQKEGIKRLRDDSTEKNNLLAEKNKMLTVTMNNEIRIATLSERNRIAREIHDNVGHMLSRAILQLGAIMTVYRKDTIYDNLVPIKYSLDTAMNNIRESVHDLHKDGFNVKETAESILSALGNYDIDFICDISQNADKEVKYAFITILKEAVTNIEKYCNGNKVRVVISELEEYYQMLIQDNGVVLKGMFHPGAGIGTSNMEERVKALNGIITFGTKDGFRIFISVPKKRQNEDG